MITFTLDVCIYLLVGFHVVQLYLSPANARYPLYSWVGWSNVSEDSCLRKHNGNRCCLTSVPQLYSWVDWVKFLFQGSYNKHPHLEIELGSFGSQADTQNTGLLLKKMVLWL